MKQHGCLYQIDFDNGKSYIGVSLFGIEKRLAGHKDAARRNSPKAMIHRAIAKYGPGAYVARTLVICDDFEYLKELETRAIRALCTKAPNGYNMTDGGDGQLGKVWSQESREKLAAWRRGKDFIPPDTRLRLAEALRNRVFSAEHRRKLSEAGKKRKRRILGPHSEEHRAKIAAAHRGLGHTADTKATLSGIAKAWWAAREDRCMSEEQKRKISAAHVARLAKRRMV